MISKLSKHVIDYQASQPTTRIFTADKVMNELMTWFVDEAKSDDIWVSVDAGNLPRNQLHESEGEIIKSALEAVKGNCIETTSPRNRFVRVTCRHTQNQTFIKIVYSCENHEIRYFDKRLAKIRTKIERAGGYIKLQLDRDEGVLKIAIPDEAIIV